MSTRVSLGLPRQQRLRRPSEFEVVRRGALKTRDPFFFVNADKVEQGSKIGIAVSKRVSHKAVTRNRIKRQIRESFRIHQAELQSLHIVVVAQAAAGSADNSTLARSLNNHWRRLASSCSKS